MKLFFLYRDIFFYPILFSLWAVYILVQHGNYRYFGIPPSSSSTDMHVEKAFNQKDYIDKIICNLHKSFIEEQRPLEKGHIYHNIGTVYYDQYKKLKNKELLDSAHLYCKRSIKYVNNVPRFYYNMGRVFTEYRNHLQAKVYYEKALRLDSNHIRALHNLGLLYYFELGQREPAKKFIKRALSIKHDLPICNYVLGMIAQEEKDFNKAVKYYNKEIKTYSICIDNKKELLIPPSTMRFVITQTHLRLALLYSTEFKNKELAQKNLNEYLRLEKDKRSKDSAIKMMKKYWEVRGKSN